jgi:hypothetical protein
MQTQTSPQETPKETWNPPSLQVIYSVDTQYNYVGQEGDAATETSFG